MPEPNSACRSVSQAIAFAVLATLGVGISALAVLTSLDWFYPVLAYFVVAYLGWQHFVAPDDDDDNDEGGAATPVQSPPSNQTGQRQGAATS